MRSYKLSVLALISMLALSSMIFTTVRNNGLASSKNDGNYAQNHLQDNDELDEQLPLIDYDAPESNDSKKRARRRKKGAKYDNASNPLSDAYARKTHVNEGVPRSALPVAVSSVILIGTVTEVEAVLSNDRTGVYTEIAIQIEEILKDDSQQLTVGSSVVVERQGGRVKFPSGHITTEHVTGTGIPHTGKRYLLFLTRVPLDLYIHFGYELIGSKVGLLDKYPGHPSQSYKGADVKKLISDLRAALTK
jgi:hypothetical protein